MTKSWLKAASLAAALTLVAAGCGGDGDENDAAGPSETPATSEAAAGAECTEERQGGQVTMGVLTQPRGLDPLVAAGAASTGGIEMAAIYDTLVEYDIESGEYRPRVAESLEPNDDFTEWTLTLREGVTFGNGDPLTAEAVEASITRFQSDANTGPYRALALTITGMEVVDERTLVLTLDEGWAGFPFVLANSGGMIVNTAVADAAGEGFGTNPVGAGVGPYEITRFAANEEIVLTAKDDYWDGPVCIEELRFVAIPGDAITYDSFQSGELQAAFLRDPVVIRNADDAGVASLKNLQNAGNVILINNGVRDSEPVTADVRVRRAISAAIDVEAINERVYEGAGQPTKAVIGEKSRLADGIELDEPPTDPELAQGLVEEVKGETDWDGSLRLTCPQAREEAALTVQAQLNAVGFDVELDMVPTTSELVEKVIVRADFDISCWGLNYLDDALWPTMNNTMRSDSPSNYGGHQNPAFDEALAALRVASTVEEEQAAVEDLQAAWTDTVPAVILESLQPAIILAEDLQGVTMTINTLVFFDDAYLE